jgi:hypothetical protein
MPEVVSIDKKNKIILVRSWGAVTYEDLSSTREKVFELFSKKGLYKVLVDAREQTSIITISETYDFSESIGNDPRSREIKWAIVPSKHTIEQASFLETTSLNRGLNVKLYDSIDSAMKWLNE